MKSLLDKIILSFKFSLSENWEVEFKALEWTGTRNDFIIFENSIWSKFTGENRGLYWAYHILGMKLIELSVCDTKQPTVEVVE